MSEGIEGDMRKVVVVINPDFLYNDVRGVYADRIRRLGLTAYEDTLGTVGYKVKRMLVSMVNAHRAKGDVEEWLNSSGVEWVWLDEYDGGVKLEDAVVEPSQAVALNVKVSSTDWEPVFLVGLAV